LSLAEAFSPHVFINAYSPCGHFLLAGHCVSQFSSFRHNENIDYGRRDSTKLLKVFQGYILKEDSGAVYLLETVNLEQWQRFIEAGSSLWTLH
jgi:hypothetical protein